MHERRSVGRTRLLKHAKILATRKTIACTIVDLTNRGACIRLADTRDVPDRFELSFGNRHAHRACRVTWRTENQLGIAFERGECKDGGLPIRSKRV
jgi:PilZ domain